MKKTEFLLLLLLSPALMRPERGWAMPFYGGNDYKPASVYQTGPVRAMIDATAAFIPADKISWTGWASTNALGKEFNLCKGEPYYDEPWLARCSGVLVRHNAVLTAAHCAKDCGSTKIVFGYDSTERRQRFPREQVYSCAKVVAASADDKLAQNDMALVYLDRPVSGRAPVRISAKTPTAGMRVINAGHPLNLPTKVQDNAVIKLRIPGFNSFVTDMDCFKGQSGSAIFDDEGALLGIASKVYYPGESSLFAYDERRKCNQLVRVADGAPVVFSGDPPTAEIAALSKLNADGTRTIPSGAVAGWAAPLLKELFGGPSAGPLERLPDPDALMPDFVLRPF
ncbi:MAG TPA: serine protease [Elusimicrobiales bacterium]|nr:serine protease [Elusimicrobiales bacterium]